MRVALALVAAVSVSAAVEIGQAKEPPPNRALAALFERQFQFTLDESPEFATFNGLEGHNDRLTDQSPAAIERRRARIKFILAELGRFDPKKLNTQDRISREMMLFSFGIARDEMAFYAGLPIGPNSDNWLQVYSMGGPQLAFVDLVEATPFHDVHDYEDYLKRLDALPKRLAQTIDILRVGLRTGWLPSRAAMRRAPATFESVGDAVVTKSPLWKPFTAFPDAVTAADRDRLAAAGRQTLETKVRPAFVAMRKFIEDEYIPKCPESVAASALPGGDAFYALRVREHTTSRMTPAEIHELGLREVARIRAEMDRVIGASGYKGTFAQFLKFINSDAMSATKTPEARLVAYRDIAKRADAQLPKLFAELPRVPYGVRAMDPAEGDNVDHFTPPALDGSRACFFEVNVNNLTNRPSYKMEATLLHEAVPGHCLQAARALELKNLPRFRRSNWYVAYGEGWALYAESLGFEMGFYQDPYSQFGRLAMEMLRAARLVVDTGIHAQGWARERASKYLMENTGLPADTAAAEVDRYSLWPGQALGYKIGELKIKDLKARAQAALGDRFDVRRFHNALLDDGPVPLTVLEARIDEWIATMKATPKVLSSHRSNE